MIEAATAAAFLMSSLYGAGHASAQTASAASVMPAVTITRTLTDPKEVEAYVRKEFANVPILVEIARCESTFRQFGENGQAIRGRVDRADVGVMQINERYHSESAIKLGHDIYSIDGNLAFARYLYDKYGTSPWSASKKCWGTSAPIAKK